MAVMTGVQSEPGGQDPDGLEHQARMDLEAAAIEYILKKVPGLEKTKKNNRGYDLFKPGANGEPIRWIEVKAMTQSMAHRPVGLSSAQFDCAQEHRAAYWIYVVEYAGSEKMHLVSIQDPAGKARTFTFDGGWRAVADPDVTSG